jgi:hypothetical protein
MVKLIIVFLFILTPILNAQDIDTCFTQEEIINISTHITELQLKDSLSTAIIVEQEYQLQQMNSVFVIDSIIIENYKIREKFYLENELKYKELIIELEPKWYEDPKLWFSAGLIIGFFIGQ